MKCPVCQTTRNVATSITHGVYAHHCPAAGVPIYWNSEGVFSNNPGLRGKPRKRRDDTEKSLGRITGGQREASDWRLPRQLRLVGRGADRRVTAYEPGAPSPA